MPVLTQAHWPCACASPCGVWSVLKNLDLGGRTIHLRDARPWPPPPKSPKTNEKSMIRALEPPGTTPERSGTAQDHLKASISHQESLKTTQSGLHDAQSGLQDAMLCAWGAVLCAWGAILCAQGTILCVQGVILCA